MHVKVSRTCHQPPPPPFLIFFFTIFLVPLNLWPVIVIDQLCCSNTFFRMKLKDVSLLESDAPNMVRALFSRWIVRLRANTGFSLTEGLIWKRTWEGFFPLLFIYLFTLKMLQTNKPHILRNESECNGVVIQRLPHWDWNRTYPSPAANT